MAYINGPQTGWKLDATEGTETTLVAADFVGDWSTQEILMDRKVIELSVSGTLGTAKTTVGTKKGSISGFTMPISNLKEAGILQAAGFDAGSGTMNIGGQTYTKTGANASRISIKSLTFNQYLGYELVKLTSAKPTSLSISGKLNENIILSADFSGIYTASSSIGFTLAQVPATVSPIVFAGSSITINGTALKCSEITVDLGLVYTDVGDGSLVDGYGMGEITDIKPKITINPLAVSSTTFDFYTKYNIGETVSFLWSFGSGTGNTYSIAASGVIQSMKGTLDNDIQRKEIVLTVVNSASNFGVRITNA